MSLKKRWLVVLLSLFTLGGCAVNEEADVLDGTSFTLNQIGLVNYDDLENPLYYIVSPADARDKVYISYPQTADGELSSEILDYPLEHVTVTEEEIVLTFEGGEHAFERLSESVVQNENKVQYEYQVNE